MPDEPGCVRSAANGAGSRRGFDTTVALRLACLVLLLLPAFASGQDAETATPIEPSDSPFELERERATRAEAIEGPIDRSEYQLGPGDRVTLTLSGPLQRLIPSTVTAEGTLLAPPAVGVRVAGLTVEAAESAVRAALDEYYRGVAVRLDVVAVRSFEVYVLGMVQKIGTYVADGTTRVSTAIHEAGGFLSTGSLRRVQLLRRDGSEISVDVHRFLLLGDFRGNPYLSDGDRIVVPIAGEKVTLYGAVGRPGEYETIPGETVRDLIALAGGPLPVGDTTRVELRRFRDDDGSLTDSQIVDLRGPDAAIPVRASDQITVHALADRHVRAVVDVLGEVASPGPYVINEGSETLRSVIARAGGFTLRASLPEATLSRSIAADVKDPEFERLRTIDVADMTTDEYEYFKLKSRERVGAVVVDFAALFAEGSDAEDISLRRGDRITVPMATQSVKVVGQVASPGAIAFEQGKPIRWYIDKAGGYSWRAASRKTRVIRAKTGEWVKAKSVDELEVGDTVWVPEKPERDYWQIFKETLATAGQIMTIYLVIDRIAE